MITNNKLVKTFFILLILLFLLSCSNNEEVKKENSSAIPNSLLSVSTISKNIIEELEEIYFTKKEKQEQNSTKENNKKTNDSKETKEPQNMKEKEVWQDLKSKVEQLFQNWNRYESQQNLPQQQSQKIESQMNQIPPILEKGKILTALFKTNQLKLEFSKLYSQYYNKELIAVLEEIKVYMRRIVYFSQVKEDKISEQQSSLEKLKAKLIELKNLKVKEESKVKIKELDHYAEDLEELIKQNNKSVLKIKGDLILSKIKEIK